MQKFFSFFKKQKKKTFSNGTKLIRIKASNKKINEKKEETTNTNNRINKKQHRYK